MTGTYLPNAGEVPVDVTAFRDGEQVIVCGVRLTEEDAQAFGRHVMNLASEVRRDRVAREQTERQAAENRAWTVNAVAVVEINGRSLRLLPSGRVEIRNGARLVFSDEAIAALLAATPGRRAWWEGASVWHVSGCGCDRDVRVGLAAVRLMPLDWRPAGPKPACKRSLRLLAKEAP